LIKRKALNSPSICFIQMKIIATRLLNVLLLTSLASCAGPYPSRPYPESYTGYRQDSLGVNTQNWSEDVYYPTPEEIETEKTKRRNQQLVGAAVALGVLGLMLGGSGGGDSSDSESTADDEYQQRVNAQLQDNWNRNGNINDNSR